MRHRHQPRRLLLSQKIEVGRSRRTRFPLEISGKKYPVYPVFYPVGNGMRNLPLAASDLRHILSQD